MPSDNKAARRASTDTPTAPLPLPTLLSHALVAFTIELDNEFERQTPHWITDSKSGSRTGAWLVSMAMWWNCMHFVDEKGITVGELEKLARTKTNLNGMERWRYIVVAPDPSRQAPKAAAAGLGNSRNTERPEVAGSVAAAIQRDRKTMVGALRKGRNRGAAGIAIVGERNDRRPI